MADPNGIQTLVVDNFQGKLTRYNNGDVNSGFAKYTNTFGNDPFTAPGSLTWFEIPERIGSGTIDDLPVAARIRYESGTVYAYVVGTDSKVYKIQVNDPTTYQPNYDNVVLLTTLTPTPKAFLYGTSIQFYGATPKLYVFQDKGIISMDFDGTNQAYVGSSGSYTADVPRPSAQFLGKMYFGNGSNIGEIDSTLTVTSYAKLSPGFPAGTYVRDLDVSADGNYLQITVSSVNDSGVLSTQNSTLIPSSDSYVFYWNGTDPAATASTSFISRSLTSRLAFADSEYSLGFDINGAALFEGGQKLFNLPQALTANFGAFFSIGNLSAFCVPEVVGGVGKSSLFVYGSYDNQTAPGLYRLFRQGAITAGLDVVQIPFALNVSNQLFGPRSSGYTDNLVSSAKLYFGSVQRTGADLEIPTGVAYKFSPSPTGLGTAIAGVYETQTQLFTKKIDLGEIRVYGESWVTGNEFTVDIIGSDDAPIANASKTFTVGTNLTAGTDYAWYTPQCESTYAIGIRITNSGSVNNVINKVECDYTSGGK